MPPPARLRTLGEQALLVPQATGTMPDVQLGFYEYVLYNLIYFNSLKTFLLTEFCQKKKPKYNYLVLNKYFTTKELQ